MKKFGGKTYFGLKDKIVEDSLESIDFDKGDLMIVGGMAVQLFGEVFPNLYRNTLDLDFVRDVQCSFDDFKEFFSDPVSNLKSKGYQVQLKKGRFNHSTKVMTSQNKPDSLTFFINMDYSSPEIFASFYPYLENQFTNSQLFSRNGKDLRVSSLEEVLPLKLGRVIDYAERSDLIDVGGERFIASSIKGNFGNLGTFLGSLKKEVKGYQEKFSSGNFGLSDSRKYKIKKDLYDLSASSEIILGGAYNFDKERYLSNLFTILNYKNLD